MAGIQIFNGETKVGRFADFPKCAGDEMSFNGVFIVRNGGGKEMEYLSRGRIARVLRDYGAK